MDMKYIVVEAYPCQFAVIIFSDNLEHSAMVPNDISPKRIRSAGFCRISCRISPSISTKAYMPTPEISCYTWGRSQSLNVDSNEDDADLILKELNRWSR